MTSSMPSSGLCNSNENVNGQGQMTKLPIKTSVEGIGFPSESERVDVKSSKDAGDDYEQRIHGDMHPRTNAAPESEEKH